MLQIWNRNGLAFLVVVDNKLLNRNSQDRASEKLHFHVCFLMVFMFASDQDICAREKSGIFWITYWHLLRSSVYLEAHAKYCHKGSSVVMILF